MINLAVFASGNGSNFQAIAQAAGSGGLKANLSLVICDNLKARVIDRAIKAKVKVVLIRREDFSDKIGFENAIIDTLIREKIGLIALAGFMRILSSGFIRKFKGRIINIHPSLLPSFKGKHGIKDAFDYGSKVTGVTVHFVDEHIDHGPIILQQPVLIKESDNLGSLEKRIHQAEHQAYPQAIKLIVQKKVKINGRKVKVSIR